MNHFFAALVLIYRDGKILALQRSDNRSYGFPGGKINENELPEHAAMRECFEETGQVVFLYLPSAYAGLDDQGRVVKTFRGEIVAEGLALTPEEGSLVWLTPQEFLDGSFWKEYNLAALKHFGIVE